MIFWKPEVARLRESRFTYVKEQADDFDIQYSNLVR